MSKQAQMRRMFCVVWALFFLFACAIFEFFKLQVSQEQKWKAQGELQHQCFSSIPYKRGTIFVTNSLRKTHNAQSFPVAFDLKKYHLFFDPSAIPTQYHENFIQELLHHLELTEGEKSVLQEDLIRIHLKSRRLKKWMKKAEKERVLNWWKGWYRGKGIPSNALFVIPEYQRVHPYGDFLGAVLHTVRSERHPLTGHPYPTGGLELFFNDQLTGEFGKTIALRSPVRLLEEGRLVKEAQDGQDLYLTIDPYIQAIASEEIKKGVSQVGGKRGWAIMMDPNSGAIYAFAQYPSFAPDEYAKYYNHPDLESSTKVWAISEPFEPGSTMKPISIAIALMANQEQIKKGEMPIFDPHEMVKISPSNFSGRKTLIRDVGVHKYLNMYLAMQKSSNIYIAQLIEKVVKVMGPEWYHEQLFKIFQFGVKTGIELPGESPGFLPIPVSRSTATSQGNARICWSKSTPASLSFGYNVLANSFQLLKAYAMLINGGFYVQPTLLHNKGAAVDMVRKKMLPTSVSSEVILALRGVTLEGGGGRYAQLPGYTCGGKSGTTEKLISGIYSKKDHYSSFMGFTPAKDPKFLLYVAIDEPKYGYFPGVGKLYFGGRCAAPVFHHIMKRTYHYLGIAPKQFDNTEKKGALFESEDREHEKVLEELYREWNT